MYVAHFRIHHHRLSYTDVNVWLLLNMKRIHLKEAQAVTNRFILKRSCAHNYVQAHNQSERRRQIKAFFKFDLDETGD